MKKLAVYVVVLLFLTVSAATGYGEEKAVDAKALFEKNCSRCHTIERPKSKKQTTEAWETTVMRMKSVNGCPISDDEAKIIIDYLAENYGP